MSQAPALQPPAGPAGPAGTALRRPRLCAFLASLLVAAVFMLPFILRRGGVFYVGADQISQILPFTQRIVEMLRGGQWLYDFTLDLGSGLAAGYTYYNLASVFTLPLLLFPAAATPYLLGPALMLKFACSGLFAYLWLRLFTRGDLGALTGSLLYTFSGLAVSNLIFPFEDIYALFPLLLWALEQALRKQKPGLLALAVALNALVNPAFFPGCALFVAIYFIVRLAHRQFKPSVKLFARLAAECVVGVLLSAFVVLPFVLSLAGNPRLSQPLLFGAKWFVYVAAIYFETLRALVLPPEVMHANSLMLLVDAASPEGYLPMFGLVGAFAFALARGRHWVKTLLGVSLLMLLVPVLNSAFNGFNHTYYTRWLYMPLLVAALATVLWLEDATLTAKRGFLAWAVLAAAFTGCMLLWKYYYGYDTIVSYWPLFLVNLALTAGGLLCTFFAKRVWACKPRLVVAGVAAFAVALGGANLLFNQSLTSQYNGRLETLADRSFRAAETTPLPEGVYRIYSPEVPNTYFGHGSPFSFTTTVPASVFEFQEAFGRTRSAGSSIGWDEPGLWALLGVEYLLAQPGDAPPQLPNVSLAYAGEPYSLYQNADALPLLIGFDAVIAAEDAAALGSSQKSIALLHGLVLEDAAAAALPGLEPLAAEDLAGLGYDAGVARAPGAGADDIALGNGRVSATVNMAADGAVLATLPYEPGWTCTVDGVPTPIVKADWGLMAFACPKGQHTVEMQYSPEGGTLGLILSGIGLLGLAALFFIGRLVPPVKRKGAAAKPGAEDEANESN